MKVERVEASTQVATFFFVPDKGRAVVAEVTGEGFHVVRGVREAEHMIADEVAGGFVSKLAVVVGRCDDGELFDDVQFDVRAMYLLASDIVKTKNCSDWQEGMPWLKASN